RALATHGRLPGRRRRRHVSACQVSKQAVGERELDGFRAGQTQTPLETELMRVVDDEECRPGEAAIEDTLRDLTTIILARNSRHEDVGRRALCKQERQRTKAADADALEPGCRECGISEAINLSHRVENDELHVATSRAVYERRARPTRIRRLIDT